MADSDKKTDVAEKSQPPNASPQWPTDLSRSSSSLHASNFNYSPSHLSVKEPTPSIASDISLPIATQELRQRLRQLEKYDINYLFCIKVAFFFFPVADRNSSLFFWGVELLDKDLNYKKLITIHSRANLCALSSFALIKWKLKWINTTHCVLQLDLTVNMLF